MWASQAITETHTMRKLLPSQSYMEGLLFLPKLHWVSTLKVFWWRRKSLSPSPQLASVKKNQVAVIDSIFTTRFLLLKA